MPLPEDETTWGDLHVMFATASGNVRRNLLSDFVDIRTNGKIAMKLDPGDRLIAVQTCGEDQDVLLAARRGKCIRFEVTDVRVFKGRDSTGVRGIRLEDGDDVISMSILNHVEVDTETRDAYLRLANARRRAAGEAVEGDEEGGSASIAVEEFERLAAAEQFILTVTANGFGKRTSAYEYRVTGRGGQGIANIEMSGRNGHVVASFPIAAEDQIMLVTDGGKLIRMPVHDIRIAGRKTQGVVLLRTAEEEHVVSAVCLSEVTTNGDDAEDEAPGGDEQTAGGGDADGEEDQDV